MAQVLLVEPDAGIRMYAGVVFRDAGHRVTVAADRSDALELAVPDRFDLTVLGDIEPGRAAVELAAALHRQGLAPARIALHTADPLAAVDAELRSLAVDVVPRPARADELLALTRLAPDLHLV